MLHTGADSSSGVALPAHTLYHQESVCTAIPALHFPYVACFPQPLNTNSMQQGKNKQSNNFFILLTPLYYCVTSRQFSPFVTFHFVCVHVIFICQIKLFVFNYVLCLFEYLLFCLVWNCLDCGVLIYCYSAKLMWLRCSLNSWCRQVCCWQKYGWKSFFDWLEHLSLGCNCARSCQLSSAWPWSSTDPWTWLRNAEGKSQGPIIFTFMTLLFPPDCTINTWSLGLAHG